MDASAEVTIVRDRWGIGHAEAGDAGGAFWAQGWLAASDRVWQMEWDRWRALGRWAEVAGRPALAEDIFFRRLGLAEVAQAHWQRLGPRTKAMTEAYAAGVNAWLDDNLERLPPEFAHHPEPPERWEPWHCVAVYHQRHLFMGTLHRKLWRGIAAVKAGPAAVQAMVGDPFAATPIVPGVPGAATNAGPEVDGGTIGTGHLGDVTEVLAWAAAELAALDVDGGSNSWAVHGSRTATGKPLLAGDPHRGLEFPNVYYQCHLACDAFDVIGLAFPGVPGFPHFGHNARVAWCITHGMADDTDVFVERDLPPVERTETIDVYGDESVTVQCARTPRGPVVLGNPDGDGPVLSMMWTGLFGDDTTFDCLLPMLESASVDDLEAAVANWVLPVNSLLSADVDGNISYRVRGRLVERPVANRWVPVPGDDAHAWDGLAPVPASRLHAWRNPDRGFLVTANNYIGLDGPYVSLDYARPTRHNRIVELLSPLTRATVDDMTTIHRDTRSLLAPVLTELVLTSLSSSSASASAPPATKAGRQALDLLQGWDFDLAVDSAAATVYAGLRRQWAVEVGRRLGLLSAELGEPGWPSSPSASRTLMEAATTLLISGPSATAVVPGLDSSDDFARLLAQLIDKVAAELVEDFGPDPSDWTWGRAHTMVAPHPLAAARVDITGLHPPTDGCPGDSDTVRAGATMPLTGDRMSSGSVARYVFDLADWDHSGWVVPHGVSGVRGSGHDLDQRPTWLAGELLPMAYSAGAVAAASVSVDRLCAADVPAAPPATAG